MAMIELTQAETEVLHFLTEELLTPKQIATRRKCSQQAISKIIVRLKKKGAYGLAYSKVVKNLSTKQPQQPIFLIEHPIRLHNQEFNIRILYKDNRYQEARQRANVLNIDNNTVRLYKDTIEIYSGNDFKAETPQKATANSFNYWNRFIQRLEHELKVILIKPRSQNIKLVNAHYSEINNELSKDALENSYKIKVFTTDTGKLWFLVDNSFNLKEAETVHPETSKADIEKIRQVFNDYRDKTSPLPSEMYKIILELANYQKETSAGLTSIITLIKKQLEPPREQKQIPTEKPEYIG